MQEDPPTGNGSADWSDLMDLSEIDLADLDRVPPSVLIESVRRILRADDKRPAAYQQFQAII
jgi:FXSXX-COOH protein